MRIILYSNRPKLVCLIYLYCIIATESRNEIHGSYASHCLTIYDKQFKI